jgi:hypothetical protein
MMKKFKNIKERSGMNIRSGKVVMEVKDRDWLFSMIELLQHETEFLEMKLREKDEILRRSTSTV